MMGADSNRAQIIRLTSMISGSGVRRSTTVPRRIRSAWVAHQHARYVRGSDQIDDASYL